MSDVTAALITAKETVTFRRFTQAPPATRLRHHRHQPVRDLRDGHRLVPQRAPAQPSRLRARVGRPGGRCRSRRGRPAGGGPRRPHGAARVRPLPGVPAGTRRVLPYGIAGRQGERSARAAARRVRRPHHRPGDPGHARSPGPDRRGGRAGRAGHGRLPRRAAQRDHGRRYGRRAGRRPDRAVRAAVRPGRRRRGCAGRRAVAGAPAAGHRAWRDQRRGPGRGGRMRAGPHPRRRRGRGHRVCRACRGCCRPRSTWPAPAAWSSSSAFSPSRPPSTPPGGWPSRSTSSPRTHSPTTTSAAA